MKISDEKLHNIRHSLAHILASAVIEMFPKAQLGVGPVIENGFFYDFLLPRPLTPEDIAKIEKRMRELVKSKLPFERQELTTHEAKTYFDQAHQPFKIELIKDIEKFGTTEADKILNSEASLAGEKKSSEKVEKVSLYKTGKFTDLCRGGHVENTSEIDPQSFKLSKISGAYWRGDQKNPQMQRIYGLAFATKLHLEEYLKMQEEAEKRDHKKLGPKLGLFMFHHTSPGMPYWLPKGVIMYNELVNFWRFEHSKRNYQEIVSPLLNKKELYQTSGHYEHYWEDMFVVKTKDNEEYALKPMNCPNAMVVFGSQLRSYKDLPLRLSDTDTLHRNEISGALNGLLRVREFRQDDAHCFVSEDQIGQEYEEIFEIVEKFYSIFGLEYSFRIGTRPDNFMGDIKTWDKAEKTLKDVLKKSVQKFTIAEKDGAFYGPKVDILMKDAIGRQWQMGTIQLDFQQPLRFKLEYTAADGTKKTPVAIHRVIYGSLERFIGILIEHYAGAFPVWLSPVQVKILPITEKQNKYAETVLKELKENGIRVELDDRNESVGKKIRDAEMEKVPYMLIVGEKEVAAKSVAVRARNQKDLGAMKTDKFIKKVSGEIQNRE
ncbi:MAG: threonine--tRNA ligase [Candidatus Doudnabacteria bacterium]